MTKTPANDNAFPDCLVKILVSFWEADGTDIGVFEEGNLISQDDDSKIILITADIEAWMNDDCPDLHIQLTGFG